MYDHMTSQSTSKENIKEVTDDRQEANPKNSFTLKCDEDSKAFAYNSQLKALKKKHT